MILLFARVVTSHLCITFQFDGGLLQGQQDLVETANIWKQKNHIMDYFKPTVNKKPNDFLSKFYESNAS